MRRVFASLLTFLVAACGGGSASPTGHAAGAGGSGAKGATAGAGGGTGGMGGMAPACDPNISWTMKAAPGDGVDTDGDGYNDCQEAACGSDPHDAMSVCYACGWKRTNPGNLKRTGAAQGDVIANLNLVDQCKQAVKLWDFAQEYHILFMTAAW